MSFWESIKNKETVVLSDDAIDLLSDVLLEIKKNLSRRFRKNANGS